MAITTSTDDLNIIAALDDEPNDVGGLTAAQLKAKFDEAVLDLQTYINTVLIPLLDAVNLPYTYGSASTIKDEMDAIIAGGVSDGSVTTAKLADGAATFAKGGHGGTTAAGGVYNLINALSGITPVSADKFPFLDADGATAGSVTLSNLKSALEALGVPRIVTGSYVGDGEHGSSYQNSIAIDGTPKFIVISGNAASANYITIFTYPYTLVNLSDESAGIIHITWGESSVSWYNSDSAYGAAYQFNSSGETYYYKIVY